MSSRPNSRQPRNAVELFRRDQYEPANIKEAMLKLSDASKYQEFATCVQNIDSWTHQDAIGFLLRKPDAELFKFCVSKIPEWAELQVLDLQFASWRYIRSLTSSFGHLVALTELDLSGNRLASLPDDICNLTKLTVLDLERNGLASLPKQFGQLTKLTNLNLDQNSLTSLPSTFVNLTNLTELALQSNKFSEATRPPRAITNKRDPQAINDWIITFLPAERSKNRQWITEACRPLKGTLFYAAILEELNDPTTESIGPTIDLSQLESGVLKQIKMLGAFKSFKTSAEQSSDSIEISDADSFVEIYKWLKDNVGFVAPTGMRALNWSTNSIRLETWVGERNANFLSTCKHRIQLLNYAEEHQVPAFLGLLAAYVISELWGKSQDEMKTFITDNGFYTETC